MPKPLISWLITTLFINILVINLIPTQENQFVYLAKAFLKGSFAFQELPPRIDDLSPFNGQYYWPLGPFPAFILLPFVWILDLKMNQGYLQFLLTILNFWLILKICHQLKLPRDKSLLLAVFYILGSTYTPIATIAFSWYFAQVVATTTILFALFEFLTKKRYLLIGLAIAFATLTRLSLVASSIFFLYFLAKPPLKIGKFLKFSLPILASLIFIGNYNYQRFGNIFESGYRYQIIPPQSEVRRNIGLFSPKHIPTNLYYLLLKLPEPVISSTYMLKPPFFKYSPYGLSILILSPVLFLLLKTNFKEELVKVSLITSGIILMTILSYYGGGYIQVGYRYALDFFPFLLIVLASTTRNININTLNLLVLTGVTTTWFFIIERLSGF